MLDFCGVIKTINLNQAAALNIDRMENICGQRMPDLIWYDKKTSDKIAMAVIDASVGGRKEILFDAIDIKTKERHRRKGIFERRGSEIVVKIYGPGKRSGKMWAVKGAPPSR